MVLHLLYATPPHPLLQNTTNRPKDLYTAASVLLAAKICPALDRELDYSSLEVSWKKCIEIMRSLESRYDSARRCLATLEVFHDQIMSSEEGVF